jgi:protein-L-isoaspartate(D-aspartate) O-methyltransferase
LTRSGSPSISRRDYARYGLVAEWLRRGLQILAPRFDSGRGLQVFKRVRGGALPRAGYWGRQVMEIDYSQARVKMVDGQVRTTDVTDLGLLSAFLEVPREQFVPQSRRALAYIDEDVEISAGRYLMEPSPLAKLLQLAEIGPNDIVLDVGCGTGYSSALISKLAGSVIALESDPMLNAAANSNLAQLGCDNVAVVQGDLAEGYAGEGPYEVIFVGGSVDAVPSALFDQLKEDGRLVVVEGRGNAGVAKVYLRSGGAVAGRRAFNAAIKPLPGFETAASFQF